MHIYINNSLAYFCLNQARLTYKKGNKNILIYK